MAHPERAPEDDAAVLDLFFTEEGETWRVFVRPSWLPRYLHQCFDEHGEAVIELLDFDDLDRQAAAAGVDIGKRTARSGGLQIRARGRAATVVAVWLSTAFASGIRMPSKNPPRRETA